MRRRALLMGGKKRFANELVWYAPLDGDREDYSRKFPPNPTLIDSVLGFTNFGDFQALAGNGSNNGGRFSKATYPKIILLDGANQINFSLSAIIHTNDSVIVQIMGNEEWGTSAQPAYTFRLGFGFPVFFKYTTKSNYRRFGSPTKVVNDQFTHVAFVCDENDVAYFYINGVKYPAIVSDIGTYTGMVENNSPNFYIAGTNNADYLNSGGYLRELGMFKNYLLTDEDIAWIYNGGNFRKLL